MDLNLLYELQLQEINLQNLHKRITQLKSDDLLHRLKQEYLDLKQQYLNLSDNLNKESKLSEGKKRSIEQLQENKKNYEELKYSPEINNAKKLKMIEKQIIDVDNNIKQETKKNEEIANKVNGYKDEITIVKKKLIFIKNKLEKTQSNNKEELESLEKEQIRIKELVKDIKEQIDENSINEYLKLKSRFNNPISAIDSRKCTGCSVDVPSINYESVRAGEIVKCESCGRLLLYKKRTN